MVAVRADAEGVENSRITTSGLPFPLIWIRSMVVLCTPNLCLKPCGKQNHEHFCYFVASLLHVFPVVLIDIFGNFFLQIRSQLASV